LDTLSFVCPRTHAHKLKLFLEYVPGLKNLEVPDPYYGGEKGFEQVLDLVERASAGFLNTVRKHI
jgi:protein-tyrosine phosphatase